MKLITMNLLLLFTSLIAIMPWAFAQQWIDPHDMNPKSRPLKKSSSTGDLKHHSTVPPLAAKENVEENNSMVYLKRFVNMIVNSANEDKDDPTIYNSKLTFSLDNKSIQFLKDFSDSDKVSLDQLRKLDTILSDIFRKKYLHDFDDILVTSQERLSDLLSKHGLYVVGMCVFIYISYNLFRSNFSIWYILRYFMFCIIVTDYIQRYHQLSEEAEEHNLHLKYSTKCDTSKMSWREYFLFITSHEDCEKKVVSVLEVGLLQVKSIIIIPLSAAGTGLGHFGAELWDKLPFPWNILIFPLMLIFCVFLSVVVMTTINGTPFKVNLMHLFHIEFGEKKNGIASATLDRLIDAVGRPLVLDIRENRKEKSPQKEKKSSKAIEAKKPAHDKSNGNKDKKNYSKNQPCSSKSNSKSAHSSTKIEEVKISPEKNNEAVDSAIVPQ